MAHLPQDELPSEFDVVVDGTGLVQSILAAALSRAGKSVLHLDRNSYYGELWGSLMHREMQQWMAEHRSHDPETTPPESRDLQPHPLPYVPCEGESVLEIVRPRLPSSVTNLVELIHTQGEESCDGEDVEGVTSEMDTEEGAVGEGGSGDCGESTVGDGGSDETDKTNVDKAPPTPQQSSKVTWQSLEPEWRRFNFDLVPKLTFCRGEMVDLITESSCSRYIEFRAVSGIFSYIHNSIQQVPCSRSDVFSSKAVTMMEKRKMMKFLTFCADFQKHPQEYKDSESLSFEDYLNTKELTPNLVNYIRHSIAMAPDSATTLEGLQATQVFINSLGRYGNAPFLFPIFGGGELPQAFCRLCSYVCHMTNYFCHMTIM
jgi:RAB protein geranylgeranyltransferase component A